MNSRKSFQNDATKLIFPQNVATQFDAEGGARQKFEIYTQVTTHSLKVLIRNVKRARERNKRKLKNEWTKRVKVVIITQRSRFQWNYRDETHQWHGMACSYSSIIITFYHNIRISDQIQISRWWWQSDWVCVSGWSYRMRTNSSFSHVTYFIHPFT